MIRTSIAIVLAAPIVGLVLACYNDRDPRLPPVEPAYPGSTVAASELCAHLRELGCPEGQPTHGGRSCEASIVAARKLLAYPEACWLDASTADAAVACGGLRCRE